MVVKVNVLCLYFLSVYSLFDVHEAKLMHSFEYVNITLFCRNTLENINGCIYSARALTWCIQRIQFAALKYN